MSKTTKCKKHLWAKKMNPNGIRYRFCEHCGKTKVMFTIDDTGIHGEAPEAAR